MIGRCCAGVEGKEVYFPYKARDQLQWSLLKCWQSHWPRKWLMVDRLVNWKAFMCVRVQKEKQQALMYVPMNPRDTVAFHHGFCVCVCVAPLSVSLTLHPVFELDLTANQWASHSPSAVIPHWNRQHTHTRSGSTLASRHDIYYHSNTTSLVPSLWKPHPKGMSTKQCFPGSNDRSGEWRAAGRSVGSVCLGKAGSVSIIWQMCWQWKPIDKLQSSKQIIGTAITATDIRGILLPTLSRDKKMIFLFMRWWGMSAFFGGRQSFVIILWNNVSTNLNLSLNLTVAQQAKSFMPTVFPFKTDNLLPPLFTTTHISTYHLPLIHFPSLLQNFPLCPPTAFISACRLWKLHRFLSTSPNCSIMCNFSSYWIFIWRKLLF